jgi:hypothetical protein
MNMAATKSMQSRTATSSAGASQQAADPLAAGGLSDRLTGTDIATEDAAPNEVMLGTDTPGVLYSNTSKTNLNKTPEGSSWMQRLGFSLGREYQAQVTLDSLILAGKKVKAPAASDVGKVRVTSEKSKDGNTNDAKEFDYIRTPGGDVVGTGTQQFAIRGGADVPNPTPVPITFANNGALNLSRLARSAYELAIAKGCVVGASSVDYKGITFAMRCSVQMGNEVDADNARGYGFVGEFELSWIDEKVTATMKALTAAVSVATQQVSTGPGQKKGGVVHPYHANVSIFQTPRNEQVPGRNGGTVKAKKKGVLPIPAGRLNHSVVDSWTGDDERAWIQDPATLASKVQDRIDGAWAPGANHDIHPTYIQNCPNVTDIILKCLMDCKKVYPGNDAYQDQAPIIAQAVKAIANALQGAEMHHDLFDDPVFQNDLAVRNKAVMRQAFKKANTGAIETIFKGLSKPQKPPSPKPGEPPVAGAAPNNEGLVVLQDWSELGNVDPNK